MVKIFLLLFLFFFNSVTAQDTTIQRADVEFYKKNAEFYKRINGLKDSMILYSFKNDSLKNITITKYIQETSTQKKEIKRLTFKNFILITGLIASIIVISFIQ